MRTLRTILVGLAAAAALAVPTSAQASGPTPGAPDGGNSIAFDGNLYAYRDPGFIGLCGAWSWHSSYWPTGCRNQASSIWNNGYPATLDDVNLYWGSNYTGAWACISQGDYWGDLTLGIERFSWGAGLPGYMEPVNNNVASHKWVTTCHQ